MTNAYIHNRYTGTEIFAIALWLYSVLVNALQHNVAFHDTIVCWSMCLSINAHLYRSTYRSTCPYMFQSVCWPMCNYIDLCIDLYRFVCRSMYPQCPSMYWSMDRSIYQSSKCLTTYPFIYQSMYLSIDLYTPMYLFMCLSSYLCCL